MLQRLGRCAGLDQAAEFARDDHQLVDAGAALETGVVALPAAGAVVQHQAAVAAAALEPPGHHRIARDRRLFAARPL